HALGCPLGNLIPEWNDFVYMGRLEEALARLEMTNNFPEITGRICPATCEAACTLAINDSPVTIRQLELYIIEEAFSRGFVVPRPAALKSGKRVAVIGSGPAGLAAGQLLARLGHEVMIVEKAAEAGGILRYGIPNFKLEKQIIDRRIDQMKQEGIKFETGVIVGEDISAHYLQRTFDAILIACGAETPRDIQAPGRDLGGIHFAMDFLGLSNQYVAGHISSEARISAQGKTVLVIGGGDTGADCVGTANRQAAKQVHQFEILPKPLVWDEPWNPEWPAWPRILRTSSSHEEGCVREWGIMTKGFEGKGGKVTKVQCAKVAWEEKDGRFQMKEIPGSDFTLAADLVLLAMGFTGVAGGRLVKDLSLELTSAQTIKVDEKYMTSVPGIFSAGDAVLGPSLVVRCIAQARQAAQAIHDCIMQK
ncbi:MAG: glutamate synthase subunit beta, partial [Pseudomonadota bacterium]